VAPKAKSPSETIMANNPDKPERPRVEPEIIPPDRSGGPDDRGFAGRGPGWPPPYSTTARGTHRVYISRIGPLGFALLILVIGLLAAVMLLILIGAALIWIPVVAVLVIAAAIASLMRRL
jgi:hypothetical protein